MNWHEVHLICNNSSCLLKFQLYVILNQSFEKRINAALLHVQINGFDIPYQLIYMYKFGAYYAHFMYKSREDVHTLTFEKRCTELRNLTRDINSMSKVTWDTVDKSELNGSVLKLLHI